MQKSLINIIKNIFSDFSFIDNSEYITEKTEKIEKFLNFLKEENLNKNLVSRKTTDEELINKHVLSSLLFIKHTFLLKNDGVLTEKILDIGSGAGFPAIIVAIFLENSHVSVMDSVQKKIDFLYDSAKLLNLRNVECFWGRIEDFSEINSFKNSFDIVTARALGTIELTTNLAMPLLKLKGIFLTIKSFNQESEIKNAFLNLSNTKNFEFLHTEYKENLGESFIIRIKKLSEMISDKKLNIKKLKNKDKNKKICERNL